MISIKRAGYFSFSIVAVLLVIVIITGIRQYQLSKRYTSVIEDSEAVIFQFSTIREQITTGLINRDWNQVVNSAAGLKEFDSTLNKIQQNPIIPGEYSLDLAKRADVGQIAILAKNLPGTTDKTGQGLELQKEMRSLAEYLIRFDRIIVSRMRAKVVQFQTITIGLLATVICVISFSLTLFYKNTMLPLFNLSEQIKNPDIARSGMTSSPASCTELVELTASINEILADIDTAQQSKNSMAQFAETINQSTNLVNGIINYAQLLTDSYREVEMGTEETKILQSIIEAAEKIAAINKKMQN